MEMRKAQSNYFKQVRANKNNGLAWTDPMPLLTASRDAEKAFDKKIVELIELEAKEQQPELFGRR